MLRKCDSCGKFFGAEADETLCSSCAIESPGAKIFDDPEMNKFACARRMVYDFPDISPDELVVRMEGEGVEITKKEIMKYVKDGRLSMKSVSEGRYCEDCGRGILSGRLCPKCTRQLESLIESRNQTDVVGTRVIKGGDSEKKTQGMHYNKK